MYLFHFIITTHFLLCLQTINSLNCQSFSMCSLMFPWFFLIKWF